jgi:hypothetical protein
MRPESIRSWRSGCAATPPPAADPPGLQSALLRNAIKDCLEQSKLVVLI